MRKTRRGTTEERAVSSLACTFRAGANRYLDVQAWTFVGFDELRNLSTREQRGGFGVPGASFTKNPEFADTVYTFSA